MIEPFPPDTTYNDFWRDVDRLCPLPKMNDASWLGIPAGMIELADPQPEPHQLPDGSWEAEMKFRVTGCRLSRSS